ncbi:uncharacterized protein LOC34619870 [Cyclospora cayetanensis]|uniref:Uncharacterized protein n=2 Tax=Cyclospora cayetanensis TaxID=88456 RepID=A0A1D3CZ38_9EIME|nr:uncharacterized protein LOC34619870 [Cyclospora cayetanensis]OEH76454.1 hypothetical protein cyc_03120 [Cyclospora cayetanensis]
MNSPPREQFNADTKQRKKALQPILLFYPFVIKCIIPLLPLIVVISADAKVAEAGREALEAIDIPESALLIVPSENGGAWWERAEATAKPVTQLNRNPDTKMAVHCAETTGFASDVASCASPSTPLSRSRSLQAFDASRFGPAAQYAQYLATFVPPVQQQQFLQQAAAAGLGVGGASNSHALKRLQRRAQAAAYANSVSSHPLVQGVVRTAFTAVAEALGSVTLADVLEGAVGGTGFIPVPPIM